MNTHTSAGLPARLRRFAAAPVLLGSLLALTSGCVVAVRPVGPPPAVVYAEPAPAEVVVTTAPPPPLVETVAIAPGPGYFWIGGYYHWYGNRWGWVRGHYERPPHPGARWIAPRWNGRVYIRGYWH
jgi:hypothetical protein